MPLQVVSEVAPVPAWQSLLSWPFWQVIEPVLAQAPTPQLTLLTTNASSTEPLQSSSTPLQVVSGPTGKRSVHAGCSTPPTHCEVPLDAHAPTPHVVRCPS